jgi:hypothetical protein
MEHHNKQTARQGLGGCPDCKQPLPVPTHTRPSVKSLSEVDERYSGPRHPHRAIERNTSSTTACCCHQAMSKQIPREQAMLYTSLRRCSSNKQGPRRAGDGHLPTDHNTSIQPRCFCSSDYCMTNLSLALAYSANLITAPVHADSDHFLSDKHTSPHGDCSDTLMRQRQLACSQHHRVCGLQGLYGCKFTHTCKHNYRHQQQCIVCCLSLTESTLIFCGQAQVGLAAMLQHWHLHKMGRQAHQQC